MAKTTSEIYNKIMEITKLTHDLSNDIAGEVVLDGYNLEYLHGKIKMLVNTTDHVFGQMKYKIKENGK